MEWVRSYATGDRGLCERSPWRVPCQSSQREDVAVGQDAALGQDTALCEETAPVARDWCIELSGDELLRPATCRDRLALTWLLATSRWRHQSRGHESVTQLLSQEPSVLWLRHGAVHGALLASLYRRPVATVRILTVRSRPDRERFLDLALPLLETRLSRVGMKWLSFYGCADWLAQEIAVRGYRLKDRVVSYEKTGLDSQPPGDRQVLVRSATPDDVAQVMILDKMAFEPFWQLNEGIISRRVYECPCFLVAELEGFLVGYLLAEQRDQRAYISRLAVAPAARRRGIGTCLIREALGPMRGQGLVQALVNTQQSNLRARRLYEKLGFQLTGETETFWAKPLPPSPTEL